MMIIGVDYHPGFQQIAFLFEETGECGGRRLNHSDGEAENSFARLHSSGLLRPSTQFFLPPGIQMQLCAV